jgi:serine/threonine protein kinase
MIETINRIVQGSVSFNDILWNEVTEEAKDLIINLLKVDPMERLNVHSALRHSFIHNYYPIISESKFKSMKSSAIPILSFTQKNTHKTFNFNNIITSNHFSQNYQKRSSKGYYRSKSSSNFHRNDYI